MIKKKILCLDGRLRTASFQKRVTFNEKTPAVGQLFLYFNRPYLRIAGHIGRPGMRNQRKNVVCLAVAEDRSSFPALFWHDSNGYYRLEV